MRIAYLAGGCFWCIGSFIGELNGVKEVVSGFSGGEEVDPSYNDVKSQKTTHRETIKVVYEEDKISFEEIVKFFLDSVDPYDEEGQFIDRGHSYTLAIYYTSEEERESSIKLISDLEKESGKKVYVSVEAFKSFYEAEEEHQNFHLKNPKLFMEELIKSGRNKKM